MSFGAVVKVDNVTCVGDCSLLQGAFRSGSELPSLAVDRSVTATSGNLYIAWHDGRNLEVPDFLSGSGVYGYADVLVSRSTDGGVTWSAPVRANDNAEPLASGLGTDQFQPAIGVAKGGRIGVCFYDRRADPGNFRMGRTCASSTNAGSTWVNQQITVGTWPAVPAQDLLLDPAYMGDYDGVTGDFTRVNGGLIGAWGQNSRGNPDVQAARF